MSEIPNHHIQQVLVWLNDQGFIVRVLEVGRWVKALGRGETSPSGRYAYRCWLNKLENGSPWLLVRAKIGGEEVEFRTMATENSNFFPAFPSSLNQAAEVCC